MESEKTEEDNGTKEASGAEEDADAKTSGEHHSTPETTEKKKKVGNYILGKTLGEGSFAKVRQGIHLIAHEKVAVKVVSKKALLVRDFVRKNVRREAIVLQKLSHPNIIRMYEVMETENSYYLVLEYADCGEFIKYLSIKKCLPENECKKYARQIVSAVDHMHVSNIVHRDLKLENFLLDANLDIKIIDFGLSNVFYGDTSLSTQCGSPAYAAPEILNNQKYGPAVDIWSVGVCLFAMLVGSLPFIPQPANNIAQLNSLILKGCVIPETLSEECRDLLQSMLTSDPRRRIKMEEILRHQWLVGENEETVFRQSAISNLLPLVPQGSVINYMTKMFDFKESEVVNALGERKVNSIAATYYLLKKRFDSGLHLVSCPQNMRNHRRESAFSAFSIELNNRNTKSCPTKDQGVESVESKRVNTTGEIKHNNYRSYLQYLKVSRERTNAFSKNIFLRRQKTRNSLTRSYNKVEKNDNPVPDLITSESTKPDFRLTYTPIHADALFEWDKEGLIRKENRRVRPKLSESFSKDKPKIQNNKNLQSLPMMVTGDKKRSHISHIGHSVYSPPPPPNTSLGMGDLLTPPNTPLGQRTTLGTTIDEDLESRADLDIPVAPRTALSFNSRTNHSLLNSKQISEFETVKSISDDDKLEKPDLALVLADPCSQEIWGSFHKHKAKLIKSGVISLNRSKTVYANPISSQKMLTPRDHKAIDEVQKAQIVGKGRLLLERSSTRISVGFSDFQKQNSYLPEYAKPNTAIGGTREVFPEVIGSAKSRARSDIIDFERKGVPKLPQMTIEPIRQDTESEIDIPDMPPSPTAYERLIVEDETPMMRIRITSSLKH
ncbi:probable serine/threonine-protein kinase DDB_G0277165 [Saccostrea echinata]|uniref:probable serine/threonine-protein kinase DDB_G0277165 n=1 Tax=Saccostrea echinata TaxID=191078 RepID=UPI002A830E8E|nr:probable serine/threonine-protein kinase DDB_G0277165 [Saccostrea echinata]